MLLGVRVPSARSQLHPPVSIEVARAALRPRLGILAIRQAELAGSVTRGSAAVTAALGHAGRVVALTRPAFRAKFSLAGPR